MSPGPPPQQPPTYHPRTSLPSLSSTMAESPRPIRSTAFPHYPHQLPPPPHSSHVAHLPSPFGDNTSTSGYALAPLAIGLGNVSNGNSNYTNSGSSGGSTLSREQHSIQQQRQQQQSQSHHNQEPHPIVRPRSPIPHQHLHQRADDRATWLPQAAPFAPPAPQTHTFSQTVPYDPAGYDPRYNPQPGDRRRYGSNGWPLYLRARKKKSVKFLY
jgi:hypothetical protein